MISIRICREELSLVLFLGALLTAGCWKAPPTVPKAGSAATNGHPAAAEEVPSADGELTANQILQRLLKTYREAASYEDQAVVRLAFQQNGQPIADQWSSAVKFERPNRLSLVAFQATVKSDGKRLRATIDDPETGNVDRQVLDREAPRELKLSDLANDPLLYDILSSRLGRQPIQLELLLESGGLAAAFGKDIACKKLDNGSADGRDCFRVEVPSPGGAFVFWIDTKDFLLRRLDYPAAALLPDVGNDPTVSDLQLYAELTGAKIGPSIAPDEFTLDVPAGAKLVKTFVIPPRPLASSLFGRQPGEFFFTSLTGERIDTQALNGKIAVLVWYHDHPACEATLQQVSAARERLSGDEAVVFYAVATDPTSVTGEQIEERLRTWQVNLPVVRDLEAFGDSVFKIQMQPTMVVLDQQSRVQIVQTGGNPQLADQIVQIVERLKSGDDLAAEVLARHERERKQYDELVARGGPEPGQLIEIPETFIRQRSEPKRLKLTQHWNNAEIEQPGNVLAIETEGQPTRILVIEGWRTVVELDESGQIIGRHALDISEQAGVSYLRTTTDKAGRRWYLAGAPLNPQAFLFDENWKLVRSIPGGDEEPMQMVDLAWVELDETNDMPEILAGNAGDLGLVALSAEGKVLWRNRTVPNVMSIAISQPNDVGSWGIFVPTYEGAIVRVNAFGNEEPAINAGRPVLHLAAARFTSPKQTPFLGLSVTAEGELFAIGLTEKLQEAWNYPLPPGIHQRPIEPITSSHLLAGPQGEWWLAGTDGSVHVISEDGEFYDSFGYGAALTGLAATNIGGKPSIIICTDEGVAAWSFAAAQRREF